MTLTIAITIASACHAGTTENGRIAKLVSLQSQCQAASMRVSWTEELSPDNNKVQTWQIDKLGRRRLRIEAADDSVTDCVYDGVATYQLIANGNGTRVSVWEGFKDAIPFRIFHSPTALAIGDSITVLKAASQDGQTTERAPDGIDRITHKSGSHQMTVEFDLNHYYLPIRLVHKDANGSLEAVIEYGSLDHVWYPRWSERTYRDSTGDIIRRAEFVVEEFTFDEPDDDDFKLDIPDSAMIIDHRYRCSWKPTSDGEIREFLENHAAPEFLNFAVDRPMLYFVRGREILWVMAGVITVLFLNWSFSRRDPKAHPAMAAEKPRK